jgi:transposase
MDVHYKFSQVTMRDEHGEIVCRERLDHPDRKAMRERLGKWPKGVPFVMEASFGWAWVADLMKELGLNPVLSNCLKVEQMRKARGEAKNNKKDADLLSLLPSEKSQWWRVWMAPPEVRDQREWMRYRSGLVHIGTQTQNRIHAIFHRHGVFHGLSDLFGTKGRTFLIELCKSGRTPDVQLPPGALASLRGEVRLLGHIRTQLAEVAKKLRGQLNHSDLAKRLDGISGFGLILSHTLMGEIGQIERFRNHRYLASYSLLAPRDDETGEHDPDRPPVGRRIGKRGNLTLKWAFIEAAHGAVRSGGKWRKIFDRYTQGGKKDRNRGYIKVARELVKVVDVVWRKGVVYTDTPPARPKSSRRSRANEFFGSTRSGTGQPSLTMTVAPSSGLQVSR